MHGAKLVVGVCLLALLGTGIGQAAPAAKAHYDLAIGVVHPAGQAGFQCTGPTGCLGTGIDIGVRFPASLASGEKPVSVTVADSSGNPVSFSISQDLNGDQQFGGAGEPNLVVVCAPSATLGSSAIPFRSDVDTAVFVYTTSIPACLGPATSGDVTLTYGP